MGRRPLVLLLLLAALLAPASAPAQQSPFTPIPQPAPEQPAPAPAPADQEEDDGLNRTQELLIGAAGLVLLFGIGFAIVRDARSAAPADDRRASDGSERPKGSRTPPARRVERQRAKAKAARKARKRTKRAR